MLVTVQLLLHVLAAVQVTLDYLSGLHTKHEEWLAHPESLVRGFQLSAGSPLSLHACRLGS